MCNLYSQTRAVEAMRQLFKVSHNRAAEIAAKPAIFPGNGAAVIRQTDDGERELVELSWGYVLLLKGLAPKRVTNFRDDKLKSPFWSGSFKERRCLVPVTSFAEPKGKRPATWHWFARDNDRTPFAFAGIWRSYKGPLKKAGETTELDVYAFMTTTPNDLVATIHPKRMPVMLTNEDDYDCWLHGTPYEAQTLIRSYPADQMMIVQSGAERKDLLG